jgi:O-methyltransferase
MDFHKAFGRAATFTLLNEPKARLLWLMAGLTEGVPGDVLELGTFRGGSLYLLAAACPTRRVLGVDTYYGMPAKVSPVDGHRAGDFAGTSIEKVRELVAPFPNAVPVQMVFPEELPRHPLDGPFSLAHFDGDLLTSCRAFLDHVLPRLSPGGAIVFDDYDWEKCRGVRQAIEERGLKVAIVVHQAVHVKPAA